jgi:hypothetical protein
LNQPQVEDIRNGTLIFVLLYSYLYSSPESEATSYYPSLLDPPQISSSPVPSNPSPMQTASPISISPQTVNTNIRSITPPPHTITTPAKSISIQKPPTPSYFSSLSDQTLLAATYTPPPLMQTQSPVHSPPHLSSSVPSGKVADQTKKGKTNVDVTYNYATTTGYSTMYNIRAYAPPVTATGISFSPLLLALSLFPLLSIFRLLPLTFETFLLAEPVYVGLYTTTQITQQQQPGIADSFYVSFFVLL